DSLQYPELLEALDREDVEGLAGHDRSNDQRDGNRDAEVDGDARVSQVIGDGLLREIVGRRGVQARRRFDSPTQFLHFDAWPWLHEHEGHEISLLTDERDGLG